MNKYSPSIGDYFVVKTHGLAGLAIRLGTFSDWNHAGIYIGDGLIIEARPTGVSISKLSKYNGYTIAWNQHEGLTEEQRAKIVKRAHKFVGGKYGGWSILALGLKCLGLWVFPNIIKRAENENAVICSQLVAWSYSIGGVKVSKKKHALVTPKDLAFRLIFQ
jgi:uncharacterized protein YycO